MPRNLIAAAFHYRDEFLMTPNEAFGTKFYDDISPEIH